MTKRLKTGDVLEVALPRGFGYLHYLGRHDRYGDGMLVARPFPKRQEPDVSVFKDSFFVFYPASLAVTQGFVSIVGHLPAAPMPERFRRPGARKGAEILTWVILEPSGERFTPTLSAEERQLPRASIWNHELLVERIVSGWRPEREGLLL